MAQQVRSIRPFLKWAGIPFILLGGLLSQNRVYRDCISEKTKPLLKVAEEKNNVQHDCFFARCNPIPETGLLYGLPEFNQEIEQCKNPEHTVTPEEREFARASLHDAASAPHIIRNKTWNLVGGIHRVSPLDINIAMRNLNTSFSYEVARLEDFPITVSALNIMRKFPYSKFAKGLKNNPRLEETIKKFGLEKDPYFLGFIVDIDLNFLNSMFDLPRDEFDELWEALTHKPPKLQEAIKKFGLQKDLYFSTFLD